jgi:hypothetical protein
MEFIRSEDSNGYESFHFPYSLLLRGFEIREWSKSGDHLVHYFKSDRNGEKSVWIHNGGGLYQFDSAEDCKMDLIRQIKTEVEKIHLTLNQK